MKAREIPMAPDFLALRMHLRERREPHAVATVVEVLGSASAAAGSTALIDGDGRLLAGWVGGGCAEGMVRKTAVDCLKNGTPTLIDIDLTDEIFGAGMPCGGTMRVFVEPVIPAPRLWLMGHGGIAESLCALGAMLGHEVIVIDSLARPERFPGAHRVIADDVLYRQAVPAAADFAVIATHHKTDYAAIRRLLETDIGFIGLVASRTRSRLVLRRLREEGIGETALERLRAPVGLAIGARTPEEIALSIVAETVMMRRGGVGICKREVGGGESEPAGTPNPESHGP